MLVRKMIFVQSDPFLVLMASKHPGMSSGHGHGGPSHKLNPLKPKVPIFFFFFDRLLIEQDLSLIKQSYKKKHKGGKHKHGKISGWIPIHKTEVINNNLNPTWRCSPPHCLSFNLSPSLRFYLLFI